MNRFFLGFFFLAEVSLAADFTVGVENLEYYPAYNYIGKPSDASASKDILDDFAAKFGHKFTYVPLSVTRLYENFLTGAVDFKFPDNQNWQSEIKAGKSLVYSESVFEYIDGVLVRDKSKFKTAADLEKLGSFRGFTIRDYKKEIDSGKIQAKSYDSVRELVIAGLRGSVNGIYLNIRVAQHYQEQIKLEETGLGSLEFADQLPFTRSSYRLSTIKHGKVIDDFNRYLIKHADFIKKVLKDRKTGI